MTIVSSRKFGAENFYNVIIIIILNIVPFESFFCGLLFLMWFRGPACVALTPWQRTPCPVSMATHAMRCLHDNARHALSTWQRTLYAVSMATHSMPCLHDNARYALSPWRRTPCAVSMATHAMRCLHSNARHALSPWLRAPFYLVFTLRHSKRLCQRVWFMISPARKLTWNILMKTCSFVFFHLSHTFSSLLNLVTLILILV